MKIKEYLTFDDVQILPGYSEVESRSKVNTRAQLTRNFWIDVPLIGAPMDTVCGYEMTVALSELGAVGALHRFMSIETQEISVSKLRIEQKAWVESSMIFARSDDMLTGYSMTEDQLVAKAEESLKKIPRIATIGATGDFQKRAERSLECGANILLIDVAHGDHIHVKRALEWLNKLPNRKDFDVIAGNVATLNAAVGMEIWGADAIRVGIGGGSMCETRIRTGVGVPQLQAIMDIADSDISIPIISDGGIRYPGDVAKALAAGADTVMIGSLFAGTDEAPGEVFIAGQWPHTKTMKMFRGSASATAKMAVNGNTNHVEGASRMIESKGPVAAIVRDIMDGVKSSMSYVGAHTLDEFRAKAEFVRITGAGLTEAHPHGLR